jgi:hypothetical protein
MIAKLKDIDTTGMNGPPADIASAEQPTITKQTNISLSHSPTDASGRQLRNALILVNIVGWIFIIGLVKLAFF